MTRTHLFLVVPRGARDLLAWSSREVRALAIVGDREEGAAATVRLGDARALLGQVRGRGCAGES
jgi:hypothetical protein